MDSHLGIWSYGAQVSQPIFTGGGIARELAPWRRSENKQGPHCVPADHSARFWRCVRCPDRLPEKIVKCELRQQRTVADLLETVRISNIRYTGGTNQPIWKFWMDNDRFYSAELTLAAARGDEYRSLVQLYKALGGRVATVMDGCKVCYVGRVNLPCRVGCQESRTGDSMN